MSVRENARAERIDMHMLSWVVHLRDAGGALRPIQLPTQMPGMYWKKCIEYLHIIEQLLEPANIHGAHGSGKHMYP